MGDKLSEIESESGRFGATKGCGFRNLDSRFNAVCASPWGAKKQSFTLIELLVVIVIIFILAAILLPALSTMKERSRRIICLGNMHQSATSMFLYADDNDATLPPACPNLGLAGPVYYHNFAGNYWDLRNYITEYILDYQVWRCPSVRDLVAIDDPRNTRWASYGNFEYFAGDMFPQFGSPGVANPDKMSAQDASDRVILQDHYSDSWAPGKYYVNHARDRTYWFIEANTNPSAFAFDAALPYGANLHFYDGHARWVHAAELTDVGQVSDGSGRHNYSLLP